MIQRIQTLYLLLAVVCTAALFSLDPPVAGQAAAAWPWFTSAFYLLTAGLIVGLGLGIAQFSDRTRQLKTVAAASLLALALAALLGIGFAVHGDFGPGRPVAAVAAALPVLALVLSTLARRAIARDIALVKSMDRLR